ncbi:hypothetical protein EJB05_06098, partial [Eragrostis curvula]
RSDRWLACGLHSSAVRAGPSPFPHAPHPFLPDLLLALSPESPPRHPSRAPCPASCRPASLIHEGASAAPLPLANWARSASQLGDFPPSPNPCPARSPLAHGAAAAPTSLRARRVGVGLIRVVDQASSNGPFRSWGAHGWGIVGADDPCLLPGWLESCGDDSGIRHLDREIMECKYSPAYLILFGTAVQHQPPKAESQRTAIT